MRGRGTLGSCGERAGSPDRVEAQLEQQFRDDPQIVECDQDPTIASRDSPKLETSSDRYRYVATCPAPGAPSTIRRPATEFK